jgi:2-polyprenyl-3-methyl-5-hydroxy-6-metoxy-1,4-benzoquinol methylase
MEEKKFDYDSIKEGYYHEKFLSGNRIQRFWHEYKFKTILDKMDINAHSVILDVGCGPGTFLSLIHKKYKTAYGIDISKRQISYAKRMFGKRNIIWKASDIENAKFKEKSFDYVCAIEVIEHLEKEKTVNMLKNMKSVLKDNGSIILTTPNYRSHWPLVEFTLNRVSKVNYEEQHISKFTKKKMIKLLTENGFRVEEIETFFVISPFLALISNRLAKMALVIERKLMNKSMGCLMLVKAKKI